MSNFGKQGVICNVLYCSITHIHSLSLIHSNGDILTEIMHQVPCTVGDGGIYSILALVMYFLSGVLICCTPKPKPMSGESASTGHSETNSSVDVETPVESSKSATFT